MNWNLLVEIIDLNSKQNKVYIPAGLLHLGHVFLIF